MARSPKKNTTKKSVNSTSGSKNNSEADWGYENDLTCPVWTYCTFTHGGAITLAKTMMTKFNVTILEKPFQRDDGIWVFMFTNPFMEKYNEV